MKKQLIDLRPLIAISKSMPTAVEVLSATLEAWAQMHAREIGHGESLR